MHIQRGGILLLSLGIKGELIYTIQDKDTSRTMKTGGLNIFSTSKMISLMEMTVCKSLEAHLKKGTSTVGKSMNIQHFCPTPVGTAVKFESELIKINGKNLTFKVEALDPFGVMGSGIHERTIVNSQYFTMKALVKKAK